MRGVEALLQTARCACSPPLPYSSTDCEKSGNARGNETRERASRGPQSVVISGHQRSSVAIRDISGHQEVINETREGNRPCQLRKGASGPVGYSASQSPPGTMAGASEDPLDPTLLGRLRHEYDGAAASPACPRRKRIEEEGRACPAADLVGLIRTVGQRAIGMAKTKASQTGDGTAALQPRCQRCLRHQPCTDDVPCKSRTVESRVSRRSYRRLREQLHHVRCVEHLVWPSREYPTVRALALQPSDEVAPQGGEHHGGRAKPIVEHRPSRHAHGVGSALRA